MQMAANITAALIGCPGKEATTMVRLPASLS